MQVKITKKFKKIEKTIVNENLLDSHNSKTFRYKGTEEWMECSLEKHQNYHFTISKTIVYTTINIPSFKLISNIIESLIKQ